MEKSYYAFAEQVIIHKNIIYVHFDAIMKNDVNPYFDINPKHEQYLASKINSILIFCKFDRDKLKSIKIDNILEGRWYFLPSLELSDENNFAGHQLYSSKNPHLSLLSRRQPEVKWLEAIFSLNNLSDATLSSIKTALVVHDPSSVVCYNVGQGACAAACGKQGNPLVYFDFGGGFGINAHTYPKNLRFCIKGQPVILSHWHMDHWISAEYNNEILNSTWIVPRQGALAPKATQLAQKISKNGKLLIWPLQHGKISTSVGDIFKLNSNVSRNHSGLVVFAKVKARRKNYTVLLPGDAAYKNIPSIASSIDALIATHHGGWHRSDNVPIASSNAVIAYSYGASNVYGHPTPISVSRHKANGWWNIYNTPNGHIRLTPANRRTYNGMPCIDICTLEPIQPQLHL